MTEGLEITEVRSPQHHWDTCVFICSVFPLIFLLCIIAAIEFTFLRLLSIHFYVVLETLQVFSVSPHSFHSCHSQWLHSIPCTVS